MLIDGRLSWFWINYLGRREKKVFIKIYYWIMSKECVNKFFNKVFFLEPF